MKKCPNCREFKVEIEFRIRAKENSLRSWCRVCENKASRERHHIKYKTCENRKRSIKKYGLKRHYGLTLEDYDQILKEQNNVCAICKEDVKLFVDHCHTTGKVRGLLCQGCNSGLGFFKDDRERIRRSLEYLDL